MGKVFTYTKITSGGYLESSDEWEEWGDDFDYEVDWPEIRDKEADILFREYFSKIPGLQDKSLKNSIRKALEEIIADYDLEELFCEAHEEEIKDSFEREALDSFND